MFAVLEITKNTENGFWLFSFRKEKMMKNITKKIVTIIFALMAFSSLDAKECKVSVGFANNALDGSIRHYSNFVIHDNSSLSTLQKHMRKISNKGSHDVKIYYWDITGNHTKIIKKGKSARISGDLKKTTCLKTPAHAYRLNCVAGANMLVTYYKHRLTINFKSGADYKHLKKGECAWGDRKLRSNEPRKICQGIKDFKFVKTSRGYSATSAHATYLKKIQTGGKFAVEVINKNNCLGVIHVLR